MKALLPTKSPFVILSLSLALAGAARADFNPIPLTPGSFNYDVVVEKTASPPAQTLVTANMDAGTNIAGLYGGTGGNHGAFYEIGFGTTTTGGANGLPYHGTMFNAVSNAAGTLHVFQMPPDYSQPNAVFIGGYGTIVPQVASGALALATPAAYDHLSVLAAAGGGTVSASYVVNYADGNMDSGTISILDWWTTNNAQTATTAWICNGSFQGTDGTYQRVNTTPQNARLFYNDILLNYPGSLVTSVVFTYVSGGRAAIYGLGGCTNGLGTSYAPIAVSGFNYDMIIEAPLAKAVTATMDNGLLLLDKGNVKGWGNNNAFYEQGYNLINAGLAWTGIPVHGSTFTCWSNANISFKMPATYVGNNALLVNPQVPASTFTLGSPATLASLAILNTAGNGPVTNNYTIHYVDSTTQTGSFASQDWFGTTYSPTNGVAYAAAGRVPLGLLNNIQNGGTLTAARLWYTTIPVTNSAVAVQSIDFAYAGGGRAAIFALSGSTDGAIYTPLTVSGYNHDMVVEANAITNMDLRAFTTATMDGATNNNANTWYEVGWNSLAPASGLPAPGTIITSTNLPDHRYQFAASYTAPNCVFADTNNQVANITFATPTNYSAVSFLSANANGGIQVQVILNHDGAPSETNVFNSKDWFNGTPAAFTASGRCSSDNRSANNWLPVSVNPRLYEAQFALADTVHNVTGATLRWTTNNGAGGAASITSRFYVLAVSGTLGAVAPILRTSPVSFVGLEGTNYTMSVGIGGGTAPIGYQWYAGTNGVWAPVQNVGAISGAQTTNLTFTSAMWTNTADYFMVASNVAGVVTSTVATVTIYSGLPCVATPTDLITIYPPNSTTSAAGLVSRAIDDLVGPDPAKYLNYGTDGDTVAPFVGPAGFVVNAYGGAKTLVTAMRLYTANDTEARDPADYVLEGSNDGGSTWTSISSGALALPATRNTTALAPVNPLAQALQEIHFANTTPYLTYRWSANNVKANATANSMQISEVELLGLPINTPPYVVRQPVPNITVFVGGYPNFSIAALGYPTNLSYQWYANDVSIPRATAASYTLKNAQITDSGKTFACVVTNISGAVTSSVATLTVVAAPTNSYPVAVLADNPIAFFRLDEGPDNGTGNSDAVAQDRWGGHNGVYTNVTLGATGYLGNPADPDTATMFGTAAGGFVPAGNDSCVKSIPGIDFATPTNQSAAFSVEAWIRQDPNVALQTYDAGIVAKGYGGGGEQFSLDTGATAAGAHGIRFYVRDVSGAVHSANTGTNVLDTNWHHVVGVCDEANSNLTLYVDGRASSVASISPANGLLASSYPLSIGARPQSATTGNNLAFYGTVDEVAIYSAALSSNQVLNHYYAAGIPPSLVVEPTNTIVAEGAIATFYSLAYGTPTLSYQWWLSDGFQPTGILPGRTSPNLSLTNITVAQNFSYYQVVVSSAHGAVTSAPAYLQVVSGPPQFIVDLQPSYLAYVGSQVTLSVTAVGTAPFTYGWYKDGAPVANNSRIIGANSNVLTLASALAGDAGNYQVWVTNAYGNAPSSPGYLTVIPRVDFSGNSLGWTLNGGAILDTNTLTVTDGAASEARSCFFDFPVYIGAFKASFTYQDVGGAGADGSVFVLQNDPRGPAALGATGGSLGYSGITPSVGLAMNIYANNTPGISFRANGTLPTAGASAYATTSPVNLAGGNPINVSLYYASGVMSVTMTDVVTAVSFTTNLVVGSLPGILGGQTAYVGISGATGGTTSTQKVSNFLFTSVPSLSSQLVGDSLVISWPANVGGYVLKQSSSLGTPGWQDVAVPLTVANGQNQVVITPLTGTQFYRLVMP